MPYKLSCRGNGERGKTCRSASGQGMPSVTGGFSRASPPAGSIRRPACLHPWRHYQRRPDRRKFFCLPQGGTGPAGKENFFPVRAFSIGTALHVKPYGLTFSEKKRGVTLTFGRTALCCRLTFCLFQRESALSGRTVRTLIFPRNYSHMRREGHRRQGAFSSVSAGIPLPSGYFFLLQGSVRCQRDIFYLFRRALRDGYIFPPRGAADSSAGDRRRAGTFSRSPAARAASSAMSPRYLVHSQADCPNRGVRMLSAQGCLFCRAGDRRKALDDAARQA